MRKESKRQTHELSFHDALNGQFCVQPNAKENESAVTTHFF